MMCLQVIRLHTALYSGGDVPAVKVRWIEDSQHYALPPNSAVKVCAWSDTALLATDL